MEDQQLIDFLTGDGMTADNLYYSTDFGAQLMSHVINDLAVTLDDENKLIMDAVARGYPSSHGELCHDAYQTYPPF